MAVGVHHAASAPAGDVAQLFDLLRAVEILGVHLLGEHHVGVDEEAVALDGNVLDGVLPFGVIVGVGGNVEGNALLIQRHAGKGHIALPADQIAHRSPGGIGDGEIVLVGVTVHQTLRSGGLQLPVDVQQLPLRGKYEVGVIQRGAVLSPLGHADADIGVDLLRRLSQQLRLRAGDAERVVIVPFPVQTAHLVPAAYGVAEGHAVGIAGDDQLREHDQLRAVFPGFPDQFHHFFRTGFFVKHHRGALHHSHPAGILQIFHSYSS